MRKSISSLIMVMCLSLVSAAQTSATPTKPQTPAKKPATAKAPAKKAAVAKKPTAPMHATPAKDPVAVIDTTAGKLTCTLFPKQAPKTVANFIGLATGAKEWKDPKTGAAVKGKPLYDSVLFHRVIPNFMVQTGDPLGNGTGGPGYRFEDEFVPELRFDKPGVLAMANSGPATNGSQFFITEVPTPWLNDHHTVFGQCDDASVELVKQIARVATDPRSNRPDQDIRIKHITIEGGVKAAAKPVAKKPATKSGAAKPATKSTKPSPTKK